MYEISDKPTGPAADSNNVANGTDAQGDKEKRVVTLTAKAFVEKIERLQKDRRDKLNKASRLKGKIRVYTKENEIRGSQMAER